MWEETPAIKEPKLRSFFAYTGTQAGQTTGGLSEGGPIPLQLLTLSEKTKDHPQVTGGIKLGSNAIDVGTYGQMLQHAAVPLQERPDQFLSLYPNCAEQEESACCRSNSGTRAKYGVEGKQLSSIHGIIFLSTTSRLQWRAGRLPTKQPGFQPFQHTQDILEIPRSP